MGELYSEKYSGGNLYFENNERNSTVKVDTLCWEEERHIWKWK